MGSADNANNLLHYWIGQHRPDFHPEATSSVEATVAHSLRELATDLGICTCKLLVTPRLQNNYGGLNGGCMAALTCIMAAAALETVAARSGIVTSSSIDCLSAMPGDAIVEVIARVAAGIPMVYLYQHDQTANMLAWCYLPHESQSSMYSLHLHCSDKCKRIC